MTTLRFLISTLVAAGGFFIIGLWASAQTPALAAAFISAALAISVWVVGAYRRHMWAWRIAATCCYLLLASAVLFLVVIIVAFFLGYVLQIDYWLDGLPADTFAVLAGCAFAALIGGIVGFRQALAY